MKSTRLLLLLGVALFIAGCSSSSSPVAAPSTPQTSAVPSSLSPSASRSAVASLVGRWERVVTCDELVNALKDAGLGSLAQNAWVGQTSSTGVSSFAPGSPTPTQAHPCTGALPREHSHFFSQSGQFGSLDWLGGQVDDDSYRIVNDNTLQIGKTTFHYQIINGDTLTLSPVLTKAMIREAIANPKDNAAGWAVSVAYPGKTWKRVPCGGWC